jgi:alpha-1,6-mannosyltransferase
LLGPERVDRLFGFFWRYLNRLNSNYDAAIVTNPALAERFAGFGLENIQIAPFGVERKNFSPDFYDATARREMLATCGLDADAKLLIAVGRHHPEKRLRTIIQAVSRAQKHRKIGLYIAGDGFLRASVERWALNAQNVYVAGQINDADQLSTVMASADALIHGSAAETFGLVLAEALCSGTPLIIPDSGASATFAGPGYAQTYRAGDPVDGAGAILRLLAGERAEQSRAALAAANAHVFNVEQHFEKLFEIYERIVAERSTR